MTPGRRLPLPAPGALPSGPVWCRFAARSRPCSQVVREYHLEALLRTLGVLLYVPDEVLQASAEQLDGVRPAEGRGLRYVLGVVASRPERCGLHRHEVECEVGSSDLIGCRLLRGVSR